MDGTTSWKFLHAADLHIDSQLRGLDALSHAPAERIRAATRDAVVRLVDLALQERVRFVVVAGDIFDGPWPDATTGAWTASQFRRLREADIRVLLIRGNHDARSQIVSSTPWPSNVLEFSDDRAETIRLDELDVAVHGQSFARREAPDDLAAQYPPAVPGCFNIGVLHTSLAGDPQHDNYAPTSENVLVSKGYDYWALGHIHKRFVIRKERPAIVYSGNTQGRHINEPGPRGCYIIHVQHQQITELEFHPTDVVRWESCTVLAEPDDDAEAIRDRLQQQLEQLRAEAEGRMLAVRVTIDGPCRAHAQWNRPSARNEWEQEIRHLDICANDVWIEKLRFYTRPVVDRQTLREAPHLVGELLRLIQRIREDDESLQSFAGVLAPLATRAAPELEAADIDFESPEQLRIWLDQAETTLVSRLWEEVEA